MNTLPHLSEIFDLLKRGYHLGPEDEPAYSALTRDTAPYQEYFAPLGFKLVRHEREFFYFEPDNPDNVPDTLPRIAVLSYILVDHAANQGRPIEEFIFGQNFLVSQLPHFTLDRYVALLRQVGVMDARDLETVLKYMERIGWIKWTAPGEIRFLRPFHRVFSKCLQVTSASAAPVAPAAADDASNTTPEAPETQPA